MMCVCVCVGGGRPGQGQTAERLTSWASEGEEEGARVRPP